MSDNPIKLWPGPCEDGHETYFAKGQDIPVGWERRGSIANQWLLDDGIGKPRWPAPVTDAWYQVRPPAKLPDPEAMWRAGDDLVVVWGAMKDRADLDQWERLATNGLWLACVPGETRPDNFPIRIRRKERA